MNLASELLGALSAYAEVFHEHDRSKTHQEDFNRGKLEVLGIRKRLVDDLKTRPREDWENQILLEREENFIGATRDRCRIVLLLMSLQVRQ